MTFEEIEKRAAGIAENYGRNVVKPNDRQQVRRLAELVAALAAKMKDSEQ